MFASRKLPFQILLLAIGLFINAVKGISSLQASRALDIHARMACVLLHRFRCALLASIPMIILSGAVEIDGRGAQPSRRAERPASAEAPSGARRST